MIPLCRVLADEVNDAASVPQILNDHITTTNRVFEGVCDFVQTPVGDAHSPYEVLYIDNMFLVRFRRQNDRRTPASSFAGFYPTHIKQFGNVRHYDFAFIHTVRWLSAAVRCMASRIKAKLETYHRVLKAFL